MARRKVGTSLASALPASPDALCAIGAVDYFASIGYACPQHENPADFFIDLMTIDTSDPDGVDDDRRRIAHLHEQWDRASTGFVPHGFGKKTEEAASTTEPAAVPQHHMVQHRVKNALISETEWPTSQLYEFGVLFKRSWTDNLRNKPRLIASLVQSIVLALVLGFSFFDLGLSQSDIQNRAGLLFFAPINVVCVHRVHRLCGI